VICSFRVYPSLFVRHVVLSNIRRNGELDVIIDDSNVALLNRRDYPGMKIAFPTKEAQSLRRIVRKKKCVWMIAAILNKVSWVALNILKDIIANCGPKMISKLLQFCSITYC
jgi:hypothetical protein